jgi:Ser/Thr protein kinase RdoA (MazF antagonist)
MRTKESIITRQLLKTKPGEFQAAHDALDTIDKITPLLLIQCCCHNDLFHENLILEKETHHLYIIDWKTSGTNDPFFDLAYICLFHKLTPEQEIALLTAYFGHAPNPDAVQKLLLVNILVSMQCAVTQFSRIENLDEILPDTLEMPFTYANCPEELNKDDRNSDNLNYFFFKLLLNTALQKINSPNYQEAFDATSRFNQAQTQKDSATKTQRAYRAMIEARQPQGAVKPQENPDPKHPIKK